MLRLELLNTRLHFAHTGLLVVPYFRDRIPLKGVAGWVDWVLCGQLSRAIVKRGLTGAKGEKVVLLGYGKLRAESVMAYGLGDTHEVVPIALEEMLVEVIEVAAEMGHRGFATYTMVLDFPLWDYRDLAWSLFNGVYRGFSSMRGRQGEKFAVQIIEESAENLKALERVAREAEAQYKDKVNSEIVLARLQHPHTGHQRLRSEVH